MLSISTKKEDVIRDLEVPNDVLDLLFFGRDIQAQIRPCGSGADFAFSVAGQLGRIRASGVKKVETVFFKPCRPNIKGSNRSIRHLCEVFRPHSKFYKSEDMHR